MTAPQKAAPSAPTRRTLGPDEPGAVVTVWPDVGEARYDPARDQVTLTAGDWPASAFLQAGGWVRQTRTEFGRLVGLGSPAGWRGATVVGWSGARGPVSALAAFSLPLVAANGAPLPYRETVVAAALLAVTLTLVLSTTLVPVARLLRIQAPGTEAVQRRLRLAMAEAALAAMESATDDAELRGDPFPEELVAAVRATADHRVGASKRRRAAGRDHERLRALQMEMLEAEQQELARLRSEETLSDATVRPLLAELDRRIVLVRSAGGV